MEPILLVLALIAPTPEVEGPTIAAAHAGFVNNDTTHVPAVVSMSMLQQEDTQPRTYAPFGAQDSWRWTLQGAYGHDVNDGEDNLGLLGAGLTYFLIDDLSVNFELNAMYFDQEVNSAFGGNFNLLFRWHFKAEENWSLYVDGGAGMLLASEEVPDGGSNFNFTPQAGFGASFKLNESSRLMTGVRWHHISNARTFRENPGRDSVQVYAQLSFPF